jgi:two-component system, LytTR family, sensor kinase
MANTSLIAKASGKVSRPLAVFTVCSLLALCFSGLWTLKHAAVDIHVPWGDALVAELFFWNTWGLHLPLVFWVCRRLPLDWRRPWGAWPHLPLAFTLPLWVFGLNLAVQSLCQIALNGNQDAAFSTFSQRLMGFYVYGAGIAFGFFVYALVACLAYARTYYSGLRREELRRAQVESQLAQAHLGALKMQLRPHFLFNTLNSISSLVHTDPDAADSMLAKLGDFLRLTLAQDHCEFIALEQEITFARHYLEIEAVRFGDRLQVDFSIEPAVRGASVPNMLLQPLVENAVCHGIALSAGPGRITLGARQREDQLELWVTNSGPGLREKDNRVKTDRHRIGAPGIDSADAGIGLANSRARLHQAYGDQGSLRLEDSGNSVRVTVLLPYKNYIDQKHT